MAETVIEEMECGTGVVVAGQNYVGLLCLAQDYWLAVKEGDTLPAPVVLVKADFCPCEGTPE